MSPEDYCGLNKQFSDCKLFGGESSSILLMFLLFAQARGGCHSTKHIAFRRWRSPHLSTQRRIWWRRRKDITAEGWRWAVFTAICANGHVYTTQNSSVDWGRRCATLWNKGSKLLFKVLFLLLAPTVVYKKEGERVKVEREGGKENGVLCKYFCILVGVQVCVRESLFMQYITQFSVIIPPWGLVS